MINLFLRPTIAEISVEREIQLSAQATGTVQQNAEIKAAVEASVGVGVAEVTAKGKAAIGASYGLSGTLGASHTLKFKMVFRVMDDLDFDK